MHPESMTIGIGLVALLIAYAAVRDSREQWLGAVGPIRWSFSASWATSTALVLAATFTLIGLGPRAMLAGFGILAVLTPLIYRGMGSPEGAPKPVFFVVATIMTWSTLVILYTAAVSVPSLLTDLPLASLLVVEAALILALLGAVRSSTRNLMAAAGGETDTWTLP